jgi:hypothetical protein
MSNATPEPQTAPAQQATIPLPSLQSAQDAVKLWRSLTATELLILVLIGLIVVMIGGLYYSVSYAVNTAIPVHLESIQQGYRELQAEDQKARESLEKRHDERMDHFGQRWDAVVRELREAARIQSDLVKELLMLRRAAGGFPIDPGEA